MGHGRFGNGRFGTRPFLDTAVLRTAFLRTAVLGTAVLGTAVLGGYHFQCVLHFQKSPLLGDIIDDKVVIPHRRTGIAQPHVHKMY